MYRCQNQECSNDAHGRLIFDFEADEPVCPKCEADGRLPEYKAVVLSLVVLHFIHPDKRGAIITPNGRQRVACMPDSVLDGIRGTASPPVVNCKACKDTPAYRKATGGKVPEVVPVEEKDFAVTVTEMGPKVETA